MAFSGDYLQRLTDLVTGDDGLASRKAITHGLSEQANKTLSIWESLVYSGQKVGSPSLSGGYSKAGESGTTRLVRTVCKAIQDRGCEKSGKPVEFKDFLQVRGQVKDVPLASFKGNRFNILFYNAAGVYYLLHDLQTFVEEHKTDNKLFAAIHGDLSVSGFQAGVRALGLISKMITGPMWRLLEKDGHVSEMSPIYQHLFEAFRRFSVDASPVLKGKEFLFGEDLVNKDKVYDRLVSPCGKLDELTCQILELLFSSYQVVCSRQLFDHLEGGKYATNWSSELISEASSVPKTNIGPERIFAELDNLIRVMPRATTNAIEGITMWTQNHTSDWLKCLDPIQHEQILQAARKDSRDQRQRYVQRIASIRQERQTALATKKHRKEVKEQQDKKKKEELTVKLHQYGGLWKTQEEVDIKLESLDSVSQLKALQTQEEKEKFKNLADLERQKRLTAQKRQKTSNGKSAGLVPDITNPEDLIGKRVQHLIEEADGTNNWYYGIVTGLKVRRGKYMYSLVYDGDEKIYSFPLLEDLSNCDLRIVSLDSSFIVGRRIEHRFQREEDGEEFWFSGRVSSHDNSTGLTTIMYDYEDDQSDDSDEDDDEPGNIFEEPLFQDYQNGDVRILI